LASWFEPVNWKVVIADVNGDDADDIIGQANDGSFWWTRDSRASGGMRGETSLLGTWGSAAYDVRLTGDIDGDGKDDLIGLRSDGQWKVSRFPAGPGSQIDNIPATWSPASDWLFEQFGKDDDLLFG
jgi:hypothetical protein